MIGEYNNSYETFKYSLYIVFLVTDGEEKKTNKHIREQKEK